MCGIAGAIDLEGRREFPAARLLAMTGAIAHRGPDDEQIHIEPGLAMGAAAVDRRPGGRPSADRQRGRLDLGHPERRDLRVSRAPGQSCWRAGITSRRGATPSSGSTSTKTCGEGCSPRPAASSPSRSGTARRGTLILGRDRVGICPLYYTEVDGWLLWGSEIKALLASGMVAARPDPQGHRPASSTRSARGRRARSSRGSSRSRRGITCASATAGSSSKLYWDLDFPDAGQERRLADPTPLIDELEALMRQSVERRLRGDVPVVSYISGGLDSTVVLGLSSRQRGVRGAVVHDRPGPRRPRRAVARRRVGRGAGLATDDRDDEPRATSSPPIPS